MDELRNIIQEIENTSIKKRRRRRRNKKGKSKYTCYLPRLNYGQFSLTVTEK